MHDVLEEKYIIFYCNIKYVLSQFQVNMRREDGYCYYMIDCSSIINYRFGSLSILLSILLDYFVCENYYSHV